jgi:hypothetical protein
VSQRKKKRVVSISWAEYTIILVQLNLKSEWFIRDVGGLFIERHRGVVAR